MKKLVVLAAFILSAVLITGCSLRRSAKAPTRDIGSVQEKAELDDIFEKEIPTKGETRAEVTPENTHEMVEAQVDDVAITQAVGSRDIDEDLEATQEEQVPYARDFLVQKKTKRMQFWIEYFTQKQRERFQRFINNGEEYRHHIEKIFADHGLPKELYYVGLIESGYYLGARSHASAVGPWQFIRDTGRRYGLTITREVDERQDLFKASAAAAAYFKDLHNIFSSWELALAAYNSGEYGVIRRILKHGTRDYYVLSKKKLLPAETINYVPKVLAAMHIVKNAEKYGFTIPKKKTHLFDHTELRAIKKNISLSLVAKKIDVDVALLKKLNPELRTGRTPRRFAGTYYLRVPKNEYTYRLIGVEGDGRNVASVGERPESRKQMLRRTAAVESAQELLKVGPKTPDYHVVTRGETLISISRKYKTTPRAIAEANGFRSWRTRVKIGQRLVLSSDNAVAVKIARAPKLRITKSPVVYKVKRGDNLAELARVFGKNVREIKQVNKLRRNKILVGQRLVLPDSQKAIYTVKRGDHLIKVSQKLKQPLEEIMKLNSLKRKRIYAGQKLIVDMD